MSRAARSRDAGEDEDVFNGENDEDEEAPPAPPPPPPRHHHRRYAPGEKHHRHKHHHHHHNHHKRRLIDDEGSGGDTRADAEDAAEAEEEEEKQRVRHLWTVAAAFALCVVVIVIVALTPTVFIKSSSSSGGPGGTGPGTLVRPIPPSLPSAVSAYALTDLSFWPNVGANSEFAISSLPFNALLTNGAYGVYADSTAGSDSNPGTQTLPVKSFARAQQIAQGLVYAVQSAQIVVFLAGTFPLNSTAQFGALDSSNGADQYATYMSASAGSPATLSGGVVLPGGGWTLYNSGLNMYRMNIGVPLASTLFRNIYINGQRIPKARSVNWPYPSAVVSQTNNTFSCSSCSLPTLSAATRAEVTIILEWGMFICQSTISTTYQVTLDRPCWDNLLFFSAYTGGASMKVAWISNMLPLLITAGSWVGPTPDGCIYYIPLNSQWLTYPVTIPQTGMLLNLTGASNIAFWNLQLSYTDFPQASTPTGYATVQSDQLSLASNTQFPWIPVTVQVLASQGIVFSRCTFTHLGNTAVGVNASATDTLLWDNTFTDVSGSAIRVGTQSSSVSTTGTTIQDNFIQNVAAEYSDAVGIDLVHAESTLIDHNTLDYLPYTGITVGLNGNTQFIQTAQATTITNNRITNWGRYMTDTGAVYVNGLTSGSKISTNYLANQVYVWPITEVDSYTDAPPIYCDQASGGWTITNDNVISNYTEGAPVLINDSQGAITFCCSGSGSPFSSTCPSTFADPPSGYRTYSPFSITTQNQNTIIANAGVRATVTAINPAPISQAAGNC